jgi:hypothetical protein
VRDFNLQIDGPIGRVLDALLRLYKKTTNEEARLEKTLLSQVQPLSAGLYEESILLSF